MPAFDPMSYEPHLWQKDTSPAIPKFGDTAAKAEPPAPPIKPPQGREIVSAVPKSSLSKTKPQAKRMRFSARVSASRSSGLSLRSSRSVVSAAPRSSHDHCSNRNDRHSVSTAHRPIANWLLKLIKPAIKKIIAKIKKMLGKLNSYSLCSAEGSCSFPVPSTPSSPRSMG